MNLIITENVQEKIAFSKLNMFAEQNNCKGVCFIFSSETEVAL